MRLRDFIRVELVYSDEEAFLQVSLLSVCIIYRSSSGFIFLLLGDPWYSVTPGIPLETSYWLEVSWVSSVFQHPPANHVIPPGV